MMTPTEKCLAAYDRVYKILEANNDHYFKRTQILMIVIQSALFIAFGKVANSIYTKHVIAENKTKCLTKYLSFGTGLLMILCISV